MQTSIDLFRGLRRRAMGGEAGEAGVRAPIRLNRRRIVDEISTVKLCVSRAFSDSITWIDEQSASAA